jgi:hypothetical protein
MPLIYMGTWKMRGRKNVKWKEADVLEYISPKQMSSETYLMLGFVKSKTKEVS